ncbi:MAG: DoxX family protein [Candidatus Omnitrophota bacterium]
MMILKRHAHWLLRLAVASIFLYHGSGKFFDPQGAAAMLALPLALTVIVALCETVGSFLVLLGGLDLSRGIITRLGCILILPVILGAALTKHWGQWSFLPSQTHPMGGVEFHAVILVILLYLLIRGKEV